MRSIQHALVLVAIATAGCGHAVPVTSTAAVKTLLPRAAAASPDANEAKAKQLVTQKFTETSTQIVSVNVENTATPLLYTFTCSYRRAEYGQVCLYEAKGLVDVASGKISSKPKVTTCLGTPKDAA